jgi:HK97 family phage major capsid protein
MSRLFDFATPKSESEKQFEAFLRRGVPRDDAAYFGMKQATPEQWKAMVQSNEVSGGFLVPEAFADAVLRKLEAVSPVRQVVRSLTTSGPAINQPVRSGIQTAQRVTETQDRSSLATNVTFGLESIPVHEMLANTVISRAALEDAKYDVEAELANSAAQSFALLESSEFISGDGVGEMHGLNITTSIPAANLATCADSSGHLVTPDDIQKLAKAMPNQYLPGAKLIINPTLLLTLRGVKATSGNTYLAPVLDTSDTFMGLPVVPMPSLPDNATPAASRVVAYLIHPLAFTLVTRQEMVVQRLNEKFAELGQIGFYFFARNGGQVVLPAAVARLTTA